MCVKSLISSRFASVCVQHETCFLSIVFPFNTYNNTPPIEKQGFSFKFYRSFTCASVLLFVCLCAINWKPNNHDTVHVYRKRVTTRRLRGCVSAPIVLSRRTAATTVRTATTRFSFFFALLHRMKTEREMYREVHCERITFNNDGDDTTFIVFAYFLFILKIVCFFFTLIVCALMLFCFFLFSSRKRLSCCAPFHIL